MGRNKKAEAVVEKTKKETILEELNALVNQFNESAAFAEYKKMKEIDAKISEKVAEYTVEAETECFAELMKADNPLMAAAIKLRFQTVKVKDEKQEEGGSLKVIDSASKAIDPLKLHRKVNGGIGVDKNWNLMVEKLNKLLTVRRAIELGIDPKDVNASYAIKDKAQQLEGFLSDEDPNAFDLNAANEHLKQNMQKVVSAMVGEYEVTNVMVNYLLSIYTKKDNKASLAVTAANHKFMRQYMLEICHAAITGDVVVLNYKKAK